MCSLTTPHINTCHRGVAAKTGSVHLISSMDWPEGRARPRPQHHNPLSQGHTLPARCHMTTWSPPEAREHSHKNHTASVWPKHNSFTAHCTCKSSPISCVGRATPPPHNHTNWPFCSVPAIVCLINWHGLTFDLLPCPQKAYHVGQRSHQIGDMTTCPHIPFVSPKSWTLDGRTCPHGSNKTCIYAHQHCTQGLGHAHKLMHKWLFFKQTTLSKKNGNQCITVVA